MTAVCSVAGRGIAIDDPAVFQRYFLTARLVAVLTQILDPRGKDFRVFNLLGDGLKHWLIRVVAHHVRGKTPKGNELLVVGDDPAVLVNHENRIERRLLLSLEDGILEDYFLFSPLALGLASEVVEREADVGHHFDQQRARSFVEGIDLPEYRVKAPTTMPWRCSGSEADAARPARAARAARSRQGKVVGSAWKSWHQY